MLVCFEPSHPTEVGKKNLDNLVKTFNCDLIYLMENGRIIDQGTFNDLTKRNKLFKRMVEHS